MSFQLNNQVTCNDFGDGIITAILNEKVTEYPVIVTFSDDSIHSFKSNGQYWYEGADKDADIKLKEVKEDG